MKDYLLDETSFILQFNRIPCNSESDILSSRPFGLVLRRYLQHTKKLENPDFKWILKIRQSDLISIYKALLVWPYEEVVQRLDALSHRLNRYHFFLFTEEFYNYWRKFERYGFLSRTRFDDDKSMNKRLINTTESFSNLVLNLYRTVTEKILDRNYHLLRQLPAGTQANLSLVSNPWTYDAPYTKLTDNRFVTGIVITPPLMIYSKSNTRTGIFKEVFNNPLKDIELHKNDYVVVAIKVGPFLTYAYIHNKFMKYAVTLGSLFEMVSFQEYKDKKPDLIYVYGINESKYDGTYYHDKENDIYAGFVSIDDKNDYFGYVKKMLLTLHNVKMIHEKKLPIHGAMFRLQLKGGKTKHVVIIGDSGAGKSETIESLRVVGEGKVTSIEIIYDDMGTFDIKDGKIVSYGTEIGAFVRLDDLDQGYAYKQIDRAVFLNPNKTNARVVLPAADYEFVMKDHKVDLLLYANNYDETKSGLEIFDASDDAAKIFEDGKRMAKGTTSEVGMTSTYFANPFGPVQHEELTKSLITTYFNKLKDNNIPVGVIYTKLALDGYEQKGPQEAALKLLEYLVK
ncbi:hypothetical protein [Acholeplasma laidlawii]|uniref:Phosphoenolpyruvate carboxykinase n=2 Tax=Acholeplasma laidlawii TaxID=2148 RepID=A9NH14_ACHLI|nr:hypothetical protein [Acholeplasma laidlawii]ABX81644.1 hypothetical protein ACL_1034 [Acholeplasma laidlawii PG-8A]NWH09780.1 phosphoenolpyruvate carboxykinase [Acholeplasma laidlawii]NWH11170.1 phosphoenolpyruvate carboxykinase [Acholeplasma laidlawii]NWH13419.1 phosphoenolpyruvate carboxykinase [Acholeplasma laidlawii]NWH14032.1 phosphoenolpyruvate carboxykinase [Acholeplasma laidlawii]